MVITIKNWITTFPNWIQQAYFPGSSAICLQCRRSWLDSRVGKISWRRNRLPTPIFMVFSGGSDTKESACSEGDLCSIPGLGRSPGRGHGNLLQYSCLQNHHGQRNLYSPWGRKESDMNERLSTQLTYILSTQLTAHILKMWFQYLSFK